MKIGIIVYSRSGNTYSVAAKLKENLQANGHTVNIEQLTPAGGTSNNAKNIQFEKLPDVNAYDALIFGTPVHGFSVSQEMTAYMKQLPSIQGKKVACFVTKGLPFKWTGGNRAISQMKEACESRDGIVGETGIVIWGKNRDKDIKEVVERFSKSF